MTISYLFLSLLLLLLLPFYPTFTIAIDTNSIVVSDFTQQYNIQLINHCNYNNNITFQNWISNQSRISHSNILLNIRDNQSTISQHHFSPYQHDIPNGVIIASPSHQNPNYFFQWTRDSAITALYLIDNMKQQNLTLYNTLINNYINNAYLLQRTNNTSGNFTPQDNWSNLGEPKFYSNNTPYNQIWGRPQNDGPPLRLISILSYLINSNSNNQTVLNDICQFDVKYILSHWNTKSFDPWEEVFSFHFFNHMIQLYALKLYQSYYPSNNDKISIVSTIQSIESFINKYYIDHNLNLIIESPNLFEQRPSHVDIAVLIASSITHPLTNTLPEQKLNISMPFDTNNLLVLNVLYKLIQNMKSLYPINRKHLHNGNNAAVALGRYPEDIYDGINTSQGNPWFLATCQGANILYRLVHSLQYDHKDLIIPLSNNNNNNNNFWSLFFNSKSNHKELVLPYHSTAFNETIRQILNIADGFIQIIKIHVNEKGEMSEQFNKNNGFLTGAANLTWSYVEFVNAINARNTILNYY
ncbi:hypothetical protein MOSE0_G04148 [Monosporozyma servazzii]